MKKYLGKKTKRKGQNGRIFSVVHDKVEIVVPQSSKPWTLTMKSSPPTTATTPTSPCVMHMKNTSLSSQA